MDTNDIRKEYTNGEVTVVWRSGLCRHSGNCVRALPNVFRPQARPWINVSDGTTDPIVQAVKRCPSGALTYYFNDQGEDH